MGITENYSECRELIAFRVGKQEYCIDVMMVREIRGWTLATPLPRVPKYVNGVINLRGAVLPIVDLAVRFGMSAVLPTARNVIIVVQILHRQIGILVDEVSDILMADGNSIQPLPEITAELSKKFLKGLFQVDGRMVSMIALDDILSIDDLEST